MNNLQMVCPQCGLKLQIKSSADLSTKTFKCPKCGFTKPFSDILGNSGNKTRMDVPHPEISAYNPTKRVVISDAVLPPPRSNNYPPMDMYDEKKTKVVNIHESQSDTGAQLVVPSLRRSFRISVGSHIIGRDSSDGNADIKIAPDKYMSRTQALLKVEQSRKGFIYLLSCLKSTNSVYVNGLLLVDGDVAKLKSGDKILMGKTEVRFIIK